MSLLQDNTLGIQSTVLYTYSMYLYNKLFVLALPKKKGKEKEKEKERERKKERNPRWSKPKREGFLITKKLREKERD